MQNQFYKLFGGGIRSGVKASGSYSGRQICEFMALGIYKGIESIDVCNVMEGNGMGYMTNDASLSVMQQFDPYSNGKKEMVGYS